MFKYGPMSENLFASRHRGFLVTIVVGIVTILGLSAAVAYLARRPVTPRTCNTGACLEVAAAMLEGMNQSVEPCEDLYTFACGGWMSSKAVPGRLQYSIRSQMYYENRDNLETVLMSSTERREYSSYEHKLKTFYRSCMDEYSRTKDGATHLIEQVTALGGWYVFDGSVPSRWSGVELAGALVALHGDLNVPGVLFTLYIGPALYNSRQNSIRIYYGGTPIYYRTMLGNQKAKAAYTIYCTDVAIELVRDNGMDPTAPDVASRISQFAQDVVTFEYQLIELLNRTARSGYSKMVKISELRNSWGALPWQPILVNIFSEAGVTGSTTIMVSFLQYFDGLQAVIDGLGSNKTRILNNYLVWRYVQYYAGELSFPYRVADRVFREVVYSSAYLPQVKDLCFQSARMRMPEALSAEYIRNHFHPYRKDEVDAIYRNVLSETKQRVDSLSWIDKATSSVAQNKLDTVVDKVGYPDYMEDPAQVDQLYESVDVKPEYSYFKNLMNVVKFDKKRDNKKLTSGVSDNGWEYPTFYSYAFYQPSYNEIRVPAGLLQPPIYWHAAPPAHKYGGVGVTFGELFTRSMDEYGRRFFGNGTYARDGWWSSGTSALYEQRKQCMVDYYNKQVAGPFDVTGQGKQTVPVDGARHAQTTIAYTAGIRQAFNAYKSEEAKQSEETLPLPGLGRTNDQAFFIALAQTQCVVYDPDYAFKLTSQYKWLLEKTKVNGAMAQLKEFQQAFKCSSTATLNPQEKCEVF